MFSLNCRLFLAIDSISDRTTSHAIDHSCIEILKIYIYLYKTLRKAGAFLSKILVYLYLQSMAQCSLRFLPMFTETPQLIT